MLPLFMSTWICLGGNVASVHVHVYAWEGRINVASVQVHVIGGSMLSLFMYRCMCWGYQCCLCSCSYVGRVNVARVHAHVLGPSMLPMFMSMCM